MEVGKQTHEKKYRQAKHVVRVLVRRFDPRISKKPKHFEVASYNKGTSFPGVKFRPLPPSTRARENNTYCEVHRINGHTTKDCRVLKKHLAELGASSELANSRFEEFIQEYYTQKDSRQSSEQPPKRQRTLG